MTTTDLAKDTSIQQVTLNNELYFKISNSDAIRPFFMSIVSDSNHWLFISSNGGLTAGRKNAEYALFPYYTDDKITESAEITGSKTIVRVNQGDNKHLWEPFSSRMEGLYQITRNLYKHRYGNKVVFEEINHDLGLTFRYAWKSSDKFGFVRQSTLINDTEDTRKVEILDGLQNIMPYGVPSDLQNASSNLVDAYKKSELESDTGLGIFALSAIIIDRAEPSEALKANVVWSVGLDNTLHLLSDRQLKAFRQGQSLTQETDVRGEKGAYLVRADIELAASAKKEWMVVADVNKDHVAIARLAQMLKKPADLMAAVEEDIAEGKRRLRKLDAAADGLQKTADPLRDSRHFSNVLFNIMRGGIFDQNYQIEKGDFTNYLTKANAKVPQAIQSELNALPKVFALPELRKIIEESSQADFKRLAMEYLPLKFSRRHGDPSRPWNKFSINTRDENDGSKILDYEGNWRDIFQNWEALAYSYPGFIENMIHKFVNATTFDGYNPYRVTKDGFDWETIEPDDPWSYIGYWGDHQIIYLLKFLEFLEDYAPGTLATYFEQDIFVYANVPYRIKPFADILEDPKDTIEFDLASDHDIRKRRAEIGADGALLQDQSGAIYRVNFLEKILATLLAKLSNFIPEGGIWMNTQRPEWNDANNALVGNGVSMVTLYYLRRFLQFFHQVFADTEAKEVPVSEELGGFFQSVLSILDKNRHLLDGQVSDGDRYRILSELGQAAGDYRSRIYDQAFSGKKQSISLDTVSELVELSLQYMDRSIEANKRADNLYHAYNLVSVEEDETATIASLSEMLEGQVAVLSSGYLSPEEALSVLDGLKASKLFREDQYSYILYPDKDLPRFMEKNRIPDEAVTSSRLLSQLVADGNRRVITQDVTGAYHFNGDFRNAADLRRALDELPATYEALVRAEKKQILGVFEKIFNHKAFTGRSGTFFGYEGLGSIYWHMVSKLLLAVQECCWQAIHSNASKEVTGRLLEHYYEINEGIGVHKSPALYGAFPTDPYSHTPAGKGAQQPGMTGQVKEDILCRFGELGVTIRDGKLQFDPRLLRKVEFLPQQVDFNYIRLNGQPQALSLSAESLAFTFCQVPIVYRIAKQNRIEVLMADDTTESVDSLQLNTTLSHQVFWRTDDVQQLTVHLDPDQLR